MPLTKHKNQIEFLRLFNKGIPILHVTGDLDGIPKSSPASNPPGPGPGPGPGGPGTPRDDNGEMTGQLFPQFQDNVSDSVLYPCCLNLVLHKKT